MIVKNLCKNYPTDRIDLRPTFDGVIMDSVDLEHQKSVRLFLITRKTRELARKLMLLADRAEKKGKRR